MNINIALAEISSAGIVAGTMAAIVLFVDSQLIIDVVLFIAAMLAAFFFIITVNRYIDRVIDRRIKTNTQGDSYAANKTKSKI